MFTVLKNKMYNPTEEENSNKKDVICLDLHCPKYLTKNKDCYHHEIDLQEEEQLNCANDDLKIISEEMSNLTKNDEESDSQDSKPYLVIGPKKRKTRETHDVEMAQPKEEHRNIEKPDVILGIIETDSKETNEILFSVEEQLKKIDIRLIKLLAFQRLQQLLGLDNRDGLDDSISELILKSIDKKSLVPYGFRHVALLSELLSKKDVEKIAKDVAGAIAPQEEILKLRMGSTNSPKVPTIPINFGPTAPMPSLSAHPVRATLCPVERPARFLYLSSDSL